MAEVQFSPFGYKRQEMMRQSDQFPHFISSQHFSTFST
jgi:hypothetical protein